MEQKLLRRELHRLAERSGREHQTSRLIADFLRQHQPDQLLTGLGGTGVAAVFGARRRGPRVLIRCELDALPIPESIPLEHASIDDGVAHKCGHDGHMAIVAGLAPLLQRNRPERGAAILLFQPAEETGQGARLVLDDEQAAALAPDRVFALHNLPGFPLGSVVLRHGVFASASKGLIVELKGATAHAAEPEQGRSPALAVAALIGALSAMPQLATALDEAAKVTVIHARLGEVAFGTTPGWATVMATLRTHRQEVMDRLASRCAEHCRQIAAAHGLGCELRWTEEFPATVGDERCVELVRAAAEQLGLEVHRQPVPFAWSEDFGHFTGAHRGALFGLGAGERSPALHAPGYDFPDALLKTGTTLLAEVLERALRDDVQQGEPNCELEQGE